MSATILPMLPEARPSDTTPLGVARSWLRDRAISGGERCPCCAQFAKVYRRKLTASTGMALVSMYREAGQRFVHVPDLLRNKAADEAKARYWGLIESRGDYRDDGSRRSGFWRLTDSGVAFVRRRIRVPRYALIYDGRCLGLEGEPVGIAEVLGNRFDYGELMRGE